MSATPAIATRSPRRQPKRPFDVPADAALAERHSPRQLEPLTPRTLVDHVVEAIVQAAATGIFMPGDRIVEADVARRLNVSRVPVREALRLLESQGIVVSMPYRGMRLMEVTNRGVAALMQVRLALETLAVKEALARPGGTERFDRLRRAADAFADATQVSDPAL